MKNPKTHIVVTKKEWKKPTLQELSIRQTKSGNSTGDDLDTTGIS